MSAQVSLPAFQGHQWQYYSTLVHVIPWVSLPQLPSQRTVLGCLLLILLCQRHIPKGLHIGLRVTGEYRGGTESTNLRSLHIFNAELCRFKSWPEHTDETWELMCFSNKRWTPFLSIFLFKHLNGLHGGGWVLMQFHRRLDFSEFLFQFNWAQATPLLLFLLLSLFLFTIITIKFSAHLNKSVNDEKNIDCASD